MINLVRNLLLNVSKGEQEAATIQELIPSDFSPLTYSTGIEAIRKILVGRGDIDAQAFQTRFLLRSVYTLELKAYLEDLDNTFAFDVRSLKLFNEDRTFDLTTIDDALQASTNLPKFFTEVRKRVEKNKFVALKYLYDAQDSALYRVSVVTILFLLAADTFR